MYLEYCSVFRAFPQVEFRMMFRDDLIKKLRPQYDGGPYAKRMRDLLKNLTNDMPNVHMVNYSQGENWHEFLQADQIIDGLMEHGASPENDITTFCSPAPATQNYVVMNTKCITVEDKYLYDYWLDIKQPLFELLNKYDVNVKLIGEREVSDCSEYRIHGTFSIYKDIVEGGIKNLKDETVDETVSLYTYECIQKNIKTLNKSKFNIHIGEGGGLFVYYQTNNLLAFTNKKMRLFKHLNNPFFLEFNWDQSKFLESVERKINENYLP